MEQRQSKNIKTHSSGTPRAMFVSSLAADSRRRRFFTPEVCLRDESVPSVITYSSYDALAPRAPRGFPCFITLTSLARFIARLPTRRGTPRRPSGAICGQKRRPDCIAPSCKLTTSRVTVHALLLAKCGVGPEAPADKIRVCAQNGLRQPTTHVSLPEVSLGGRSVLSRIL